MAILPIVAARKVVDRQVIEGMGSKIHVRPYVPPVESAGSSRSREDSRQGSKDGDNADGCDEDDEDEEETVIPSKRVRSMQFVSSYTQSDLVETELLHVFKGQCLELDPNWPKTRAIEMEMFLLGCGFVSR